MGDYENLYEQLFHEKEVSTISAQSTAAAYALQLGIESSTSPFQQKSLGQALLSLNVETFFGPVKFEANGHNDKPMITSQINDCDQEIVAPKNEQTMDLIYPMDDFQKNSNDLCSSSDSFQPSISLLSLLSILFVL